MKPLLFVAVSAALLLTPSDDDNIYVTSTGDPCKPEGTARSDKVKKLNIDKSRNTAPKAGDIDADVSLAVMLAPGDDEQRFDGKRGATITGYVIEVRHGGKESCNCEATAPEDTDTHIELALSANAPPTQRVIVEVTPRLRRQMKQQGVDWSTEALSRKLRGKWVKVTGWLLFDFMHVKQAENTYPGGRENWRATCWEIHPITNIEVLGGRPADVQEIAPEALGAFHRAHVRELQRNETRRKAVEQSIQRHYDGLTAEEKKEIEEEQKEVREQRKER